MILRVIEEKLVAVGIKAEKIESVQEKEWKVKVVVKLKPIGRKKLMQRNIPCLNHQYSTQPNVIYTNLMCVKINKINYFHKQACWNLS